MPKKATFQSKVWFVKCANPAFMRFNRIRRGVESRLSTELPNGVYKIVKTRKEFGGHPIKTLLGAAIFRFLKELTLSERQAFKDEYLEHLAGKLF